MDRPAALLAALLLAAGSVAAVTPADEGDNGNDGEDVFAFGDSVVAARDVEGSGLLPGGRDSFVYWHRALHGPTGTADINTNGAGQGCLWALGKLPAYTKVDAPGQVLILAFGNNDPRTSKGALTPAQSASCLGALYEAAKERRPNAVWAALMPLDPECPAKEPGAEREYPLERQRQRAAAIQAEAEARGARLWLRFDAIDVEPGNGVVDAPDPRLVHDCIHPNRDGHLALANSLARYLDGAPS